MPGISTLSKKTSGNTGVVKLRLKVFDPKVARMTILAPIHSSESIIRILEGPQ
jgi:hypothetical protein